MLNRLLLLGSLVMLTTPAMAQTSSVPGDAAVATPSGSVVSAGVASYTYREPGDQAISIHGPKFVADYTGTASLSERRHWFVQASARAALGSATYDGWCSPFFIAPDRASPNGYRLGIGDPSPCGESGDADWYVEGRALAGTDLIRGRWGWSPYGGMGLRHLSNGTTGVAGYRTDDYLYLPIGVTARTEVTSRRALSLTLEVDALLHGWQRTRDSALGGGEVPATTTAPAFTIDGFTDIAFAQSRGWALRASASYPVATHWSVAPYFVRWDVRASPVEVETVTFTVNGITAREPLGFYEPDNSTSEFGVRLGVHF
jgi:hypothetical protein